MGKISFTYDLNRLSISCRELVNEIEYGTTFALSAEGEKIIPLRSGELQWITWHENENKLVVSVDDSFFHQDDVFEKVMAAFVYNLLDFGDLRLVSIMVSEESRARLFSITDSYRQSNTLKLGTILKPYYHLSLLEKVKLVSQFSNHGVGIVKEDETYFCSAHRLLEEARTLQSLMAEYGIYVPNVTHYVNNHALIARLLEFGITTLMVDVLVAGFRSISDLKKRFPNVQVWGHRVGYSLLRQYMSMQAFGILALLAGIGYLHIGTPANEEEFRERLQLIAEFKSVKPDFVPVFTKTTEDSIPVLVDQFDTLPVYMACGGFREPELGRIEWEKVDRWVLGAKHAQS